MRISWGWAPFIAIGVCAVANAVLVYAVTRVRPQVVSEHPYLDSFHHDAEAAARQCFRDHAFQLEASQHQNQVSLTLKGATPDVSAVAITCYRPADRNLDQHLGWDHPQEPLVFALPISGRWQIQFSGTVAGKPILADVDLDPAK